MKKSHILAVGVSAVALLASGMGLTVASVYDWSTTSASNSTADPGINWSEGMLPSAVNDSARATMAAIAAFLRDATVTTGGAGNAYTATYTQAMRSWVPGYFSFVPNRTNTGAATISRDGLAPKPLRANTGVALTSGQIQTGALYMASYNTTADEVLLLGKFALSATDFPAQSPGTVKSNISGSTAVPTDTTLTAFFGAAPTNSLPNTAISGLSGQVAAFNALVCPTGWLAADGTSGSPDLRGVVVRGLDNGRGLDPSRTLNTYQADGFASHNHSVNDPGHSHGYTSDVFSTILTGTVAVSASIGQTTSTTSSSTTGISINNTGGTETRSKNVALLYCYHP